MANIFQAFAQPVRSVEDYMADADARDLRRQQLVGAQRQNALAALVAQQQQQTMADAEAKRNALQAAYKNIPPDADIPTRVRALRASPLTAGEADALETQDLVRREKESVIGKNTAEASAKNSEAMRKKLEFAWQGVTAVRNPDDARQVLRAGVMQGIWGMQEAEREAQAIPQDPQAFNAWRTQKLTGLMSAKDQFDAEMKRQKEAREGANDLMMPDGMGGFVPNQPLIDAKGRIAKQGAASISVNTGQKGLDNTLKLRGDFRSEPIYKAHQEMQSAYSQIQQSLKQANPIGDVAAATKLMKLLDPGSVVRESELGIAMASTGMLDRVTSFATNIINGTKLTPRQRQEFQSLADALYGESVNQYNGKRKEYEGIATRNGLNVPDVLGGESGAPTKMPGASLSAAERDELAKLRKAYGGVKQ